MPKLFLDLQVALVELRSGLISGQNWTRFFQDLVTKINNLETTVNGEIGVNRDTYTNLNALGLTAGEAGYLAFETAYGHLVRWTGAVWEFAPGDVGNGFFRDYAITPQEVGWALCDGSATDYLVVGAVALSVSAITPPNLAGSPAYRKSGAAYAGTITAKAGSTAGGTTGGGTTGTGTTGTGTTGTDVTGDEDAHVHDYAFATVVISGGPGLLVGGSTAAIQVQVSDTTDPGTPHAHTVPGLSVPGLSVPGLSVPGLSVPALGVGSIDMAHLTVLTYFRR